MGTLSRALLDSIARNPRSKALVQGALGEGLTYAALGNGLQRVAGLLESEGVQAGQPVALVSENSVDMAVALLGIMASGALAMPLNPALSPVEKDALLRHAGCRLILADRGLHLREFEGRVLPLEAWRRAPALALLREPGEEDKALLIYTSGTTGQPKGVGLSQRNLHANVRTALDILQFGQDHATLCLLPLFHTFGLVSDLCTALFSGNTAVLLPSFQPAQARILQEAVHAYRVRSFSAVPLMLELILRLDCDLERSSLLFCVSGAAPLDPGMSGRWLRRYGFPILPAYGLTEATCFCTLSRPDAVEPSSIGHPAGTRIKVVSEEEEELGEGQIGELIIQGENVIAGGYHKNPADCYASRFPGWFKTGDLGCFDAAGRFYIKGRKKNMVIRGGEKVYLEDIDRCLKGMQGVADCATVRVEAASGGALAGERIVSFIVRADGAWLDAAGVLDYLRTRISAQKLPDTVIFGPAIPRTATNKVRLAELQHQAQALS
jgi:long-chain acyl-CoA synthetase